MEITEMSKCVDCQQERPAAAKFCPHCGKQRMMMRSENEIKALKTRILKDVGASLGALVSAMVVDVTLAWVLGADTNPVDLLKKAEEKKEARP